jgi:hypothetical protein
MRNWAKLADYYRQCLDREQMQRLQVSLDQGGFIRLRSFSDTIITAGAMEAVLTAPTDLPQIRQLLGRKTEGTTQSLYYAFPLVVQQRTLIPIWYTEVQVEPGTAPGSLRISRAGELLVNRRFLLESGDLTESEVAEFARRLGAGDAPDARLRSLLGDSVITGDAMLFRADPDLVTRSLLRELDWIGGQARLSAPLTAYIQDHAPAATAASAPAVTVVRSNPTQEKVLRSRASVLQVVTGPPGTGKTQTIINLIASTICDGQTVLFISKNNTAVDNVCETFLKEGLFPGILRLGSQQVRARSAAYFKEVLTSLTASAPPPGDQRQFEAEGLALNRTIARLEEELSEVRRLQTVADAMALLLRRTDENLRESGIYRFATDLAAQITAANAAQFRPDHLVGLRKLTAMTAQWDDAPGTLWERLLDRLGLLERLRLGRLHRALGGLALPTGCALGGQGLRQQLDGLLRLEALYPFLLATARDLRARADLAGKRQPEAIRADLDTAYAAKVKHDREKLSRRWAQLAAEAQPRLNRLHELIPLMDRMVSGSADTDTRRTWWSRYDDLLSVFPVICSTNLSLAGSAPNEAERFDLLILDEASQSDIASLLPALYRARRAVVVGDDQQLSHISALGTGEDDRLMAAAGLRPEDSLSYHQHSAFDRALAVAGKTAFTLLDRHYRCVPEIIGFCNEHFYGGKLRVERALETAAPLHGGLPARGYLLDEVAAGVTEYRAAGARKSARNAAEAERVMDLVRQYVAAGVTDIGVVTPFRSQRQLLELRRDALAAAEPEPAVREGLAKVEIGTIHTFQGGQHRVMLFSTVVAPGVAERTAQWFEENRKLLNVAISRAQDLLIVVCHRATLEKAGGILKKMVAYADGLARPAGELPPLPPGLQPARFGLLPGEAEIVRSWLNPPGAVAEVLNPGEQVLYRELLARVDGRRILLAPKMRVLDSIEPGKMPGMTQQERDYAFRAHFDVVLVDVGTFRPVAAVELDGRRHETDPLTQARDRLKNSLCEKAGLPLVRVRWGDWAALDGVGRA